MKIAGFAPATASTPPLYARENRQKTKNGVNFFERALSRERATRLEGSFGTQKLHYSLLKVRARTQATEELWIFFGIHTANAVKMIEKIEQKKLKQSA